MAKPVAAVTPDNRVDRWKKMWATPKRLSDELTDSVFEAFQDAFVPKHMHKQFLKFFGTPKAQFGNRFFMEDAAYRNWDMKLGLLMVEEGFAEVTVIYGSSDRLEAYALRGEMRRSLRDIVIDDWHAACAIVRAGESVLYLFVEPKMRGCMVRVIRGGNASIAEEEAPATMLEHDEGPV